MIRTPHGASPEGGSTGLERTQDQLEIALREGDESSSVAQIAPASKSADLDAEPSALAGLLARVEAAEGQTQELDCLVLATVLAGQPVTAEKSAINGAWCAYFTDPGGKRRLWETPSPLRQMGGVTASLDAALALKQRILPGHAAAVGDMAFEGQPRLPWGCVWSPGGFILGQAEAATPALALLAAMLKALVAQAAGPAIGSSHRLDEPLLSKGGGESSSRANSGGSPPLRAARSDSQRDLDDGQPDEQQEWADYDRDC